MFVCIASAQVLAIGQTHDIHHSDACILSLAINPLLARILLSSRAVPIALTLNSTAIVLISFIVAHIADTSKHIAVHCVTWSSLLLIVAINVARYITT